MGTQPVYRTENYGLLSHTGNSQSVAQYPFESQMTLSQGLHIRYPAFQIFILGFIFILFITVAKLQLFSRSENNFMAGGYNV